MIIEEYVNKWAELHQYTVQSSPIQSVLLEFIADFISENAVVHRNTHLISEMDGVIPEHVDHIVKRSKMALLEDVVMQSDIGHRTISTKVINVFNPTFDKEVELEANPKVKDRMIRMRCEGRATIENEIRVLKSDLSFKDYSL